MRGKLLKYEKNVKKTKIIKKWTLSKNNNDNNYDYYNYFSYY